jgi:hypothetical protein
VDVVLKSCEIFGETYQIKSKLFECEGCNRGFEKDELRYDREAKNISAPNVGSLIKYFSEHK